MNTKKKQGGLARFREWTVTRGIELDVVMLEDHARTAEQAAAALGCEVAQIAKSLIFSTGPQGLPVLVVASGINRVDTGKIEQHLGSTLAGVDANYVREHTGYAIGGVPPFAHKHAIPTLIDRDLLCYDSIWAAAGHPKSVFACHPRDLENWTAGTVLDVKSEA